MNLELEFNKKLGSRILVMRREKSITQETLASLLKVSRATLVAIERGDRALRVDRLVNLCSILETPIQDMVNFK